MASMFSVFFLYITNVCCVSESLFNAALYKPVFMSSLFDGRFTGDKGNDGKEQNDIRLGFCFATYYDNPGWWMVDLRGLYSVEQIILVNRGDDLGSSLRTRNFTIDVFETDPRSSRDFPVKSGQVCYSRVEPVGQGETLIKNCTTPIWGRFVRYIRYEYEVVNICEIKVMVSSATQLQGSYAATPNAALQAVPVFTISTDSPSVCVLQCQQYRDSRTCTAVNWVRTTKQCQMLAVDPRSIYTLTPNNNTDFYVEA